MNYDMKECGKRIQQLRIQHGSSQEQVYRRNEKVRQWAPEISAYMESLIQKNVELGNLKK